jgi:hypothetical protein
MKFLCSIVSIVLASLLPITANVTAGNGWHISAANGVFAYRTTSGISISASVELANSCYEASIIKFRSKILLTQYQVVTRVKPEDRGKICAMVVVPGVANGSFVITRDAPTSVVVHATNETFMVPVEAL